jgi:hypothetical protein
VQCATLLICTLLSTWMSQHGYDAIHRDIVLDYIKRESDFQSEKIEWSGACLFQWAGTRRVSILKLGGGKCPSWEEQMKFADNELRTMPEFRGFWVSDRNSAHMLFHRCFGQGRCNRTL